VNPLDERIVKAVRSEFIVLLEIEPL